MKKLIQELQNSFDRWQHLYTYGGSDPFYSDGLNMRLVRNHISYYKNQIKEHCDDEGMEYPEIYYRETPPEVDRGYMARKDEIKETAIKSLRIYEANDDFNRLEEIYSEIRDKQKMETVKNILGYRQGLRQAVKNDDYVTMRRHGNPERYLESPKEFLKKIEPKDLGGQVSMF